jgi:hypothetical protein
MPFSFASPSVSRICARPLVLAGRPRLQKAPYQLSPADISRPGSKRSGKKRRPGRRKQIQLKHVTGTRRNSGFIPVLGHVTCGEKKVPMDEVLRQLIDEYINTDDPEGGQLRPFLDYRPVIGKFLFPSPRTGGNISKRTVKNALVQIGETHTADNVSQTTVVVDESPSATQTKKKHASPDR